MDLTLDDLIRIALEGGREIDAVYATDFAPQIKADASPVTEADLRCERVVTKALARCVPEIPVVAEEASAAGQVPATGGRFLLVDPLDGTKEFIHRNGDFTVNVGLVEDGVPVAGVVYGPAIGRLWVGSRGEGAFAADVDEAGRPGPLRPILARPAPERLVAVGSRSHGTQQAERFLRRFPVERFLQRGSSLKFCLVAEGAADLYPRIGRTHEWDTAAGDAILRAAGGVVTTLAGETLAYGKRGRPDEADFVNPDYIALGDPALVRFLA